jgi:hypothetical protein
MTPERDVVATWEMVRMDGHREAALGAGRELEAGRLVEARVLVAAAHPVEDRQEVDLLRAVPRAQEEQAAARAEPPNHLRPRPALRDRAHPRRVHRARVHRRHLRLLQVRADQAEAANRRAPRGRTAEAHRAAQAAAEQRSEARARAVPRAHARPHRPEAAAAVRPERHRVQAGAAAPGLAPAELEVADHFECTPGSDMPNRRAFCLRYATGGQAN